jgi:AAA+ superfamily predicted ATPase
MEKITDTLGDYISSAHPLIYVETYEEAVAKSSLDEVAKNLSYNFIYWNSVEGFTFPVDALRGNLPDPGFVDAVIAAATTTKETATKQVAASIQLNVPSSEIMEKSDNPEALKATSSSVITTTPQALLAVLGTLFSGNLGYKDSQGRNIPGVHRLLLMLSDITSLVRADDVVTWRKFKNLAKLGQAYHKSMVFVAPQWEIPVDIVKEFVSVPLPLPGVDVLSERLKRMCKHNSIPMAPDMRRSIAESGLSMTRVQFENAVAMSFIKTGKKTIKVSHVASETDKAIDSVKGLSVLTERTEASNYIGHERFVYDMQLQAQAFSSEGQAFKLKKPRGFLLAGPPGNGKTYSGGLLASMFDCRYLRFDIAACKGRYVGDSGNNMRHALKVIAAGGRTLVLNDEVEKVLGGAHDEGNANAVGDMLDEYLYQLNSGLPDAIVLMTCNRPHLLPPELIRRLDAVYYLGLPTSQQRAHLFKTHLTLSGEPENKWTIESLEPLLSQTEGFSAYEIQKAVYRSRYIAMDRCTKNSVAPQVQLRDLERALKDIRPVSKFAPEDSARIHDWAQKNAIMASYDDPAELDSLISNLSSWDAPGRSLN